MLNQFILVGRVYEIKDLDRLVVKVPRAYKNELGDYVDDYIECILSPNFDTTLLKLEDIVGIKGRLQRDSVIGELQAFAEKITYLSSKSE